MSEQERNDNIEKEEKKSGALREILSMIGWILFIFCLVFLVTTYVGQRTRVEGHSMEPALSDGDNLIVDKISYRFHDPERFDIIIFPYQWEPNTYYIKRIIGLPGETIQIDDEGNIYIDGEVLQEHYGLERIKNPGSAREPITLGEDEYFVLGDNRNQSSDCRDPSVGLIRRDEIVGRAWHRIWPLSSFGILKHQ